jgi:hypothetical protein
MTDQLPLRSMNKEQLIRRIEQLSETLAYALKLDALKEANAPSPATSGEMTAEEFLRQTYNWKDDCFVDDEDFLYGHSVREIMESFSAHNVAVATATYREQMLKEVDFWQGEHHKAQLRMKKERPEAVLDKIERKE